MRFEARDLNEYSEPVDPASLRDGATYFMVNFVDEAMLIPTMEPVVFLGRDLEGEEGLLYFQDAASHRAGIPAPYANEESLSGADELDDEERDLARFHICPVGQAKHVFEYEKGLDQLLSCSVRRRLSDARIEG